MKIETDDEFVAVIRERFASKPYTGGLSSGVWPEYWTDERYEAMIAELLETQRMIRRATESPLQRTDGMTRDEWDRALAEWAVWSVHSHDVGATPTPWHRIWSAVQSAISSARADERRRIAQDLRRDADRAAGPTAAALIAEAHAEDGCGCCDY